MLAIAGIMVISIGIIMLIEHFKPVEQKEQPASAPELTEDEIAANLHSFDPNTVKGRINISLKKLKTRYPDSQIVILTPTTRAFFQCSPTNIQPAEDWPNTAGLYVDDYVQCVREAGQVWSCPVIDLFGESGFLPCTEGYAKYVRNKDKDGLHPNGLGHERLARLIYHRLSALPGTFRNCIGK